MTPVSDLPPKAVVFDIGGVLLDWNPRYLYRSLLPDEESIERFLAEVCTSEWNAAQDAGRSWADAVAELTARFPEHADLIRAYDERWAEMCGGSLPDTVELLEELRNKRIPTYALTNFSVDKWRVAVEAYDFLRGFDGAAVVSGEEGVVKPDPAIYRILLHRFGLDPATTFYTDDVQANVDGARQVGLRAEVFVDGATLRRHLVDANLLR